MSSNNALDKSPLPPSSPSPPSPPPPPSSQHARCARAATHSFLRECNKASESLQSRFDERAPSGTQSSHIHGSRPPSDLDRTVARPLGVASAAAAAETEKAEPWYNACLLEARARDIASGGATAMPRVVILVGLQGSGKSTFAKELLSAGGWVRVSQDELGSRRACVDKAARALIDGKNVIIDRCNFDETQRGHWVRLAEMRGAYVGAIVFAVALDECVRRVNNRRRHPTLRAGPQSEGVIRRTARQFVAPSQHERLQWCRYIYNDRDKQRVIAELKAPKRTNPLQQQRRCPE